MATFLVKNIDASPRTIGDTTIAVGATAQVDDATWYALSAPTQAYFTILDAGSAGAVLRNVASSASTVTLLAANASRNGAMVYNDSSAVLYVKLGATASTTSFTIAVAANAYYEVPFGYTGRIDGIWASVNGAARITEVL